MGGPQYLACSQSTTSQQPTARPRFLPDLRPQDRYPSAPDRNRPCCIVPSSHQPMLPSVEDQASSTPTSTAPVTPVSNHKHKHKRTKTPESPHNPITKTAVSFVHCFPSCIASSQRLCPSGKHFTAPSSSRSTFITWGRSAGTFIVASLAHLSPLAPSPNQHMQCSASTSQTIQTRVSSAPAHRLCILLLRHQHIASAHRHASASFQL